MNKRPVEAAVLRRQSRLIIANLQTLGLEDVSNEPVRKQMKK
jgi:hypothetical protein